MTSTRDEYIEKYGIEAVQRANGEIPPEVTMRDWLAGMALQGLLASTQANIEMPGDEISGWSYDIADAMLKARGQS